MGRIRDRLHVGYRGSDLLLWSALWFLIGASIVWRSDPDPGHNVPLEILGEMPRALVWWVAAGVAAWAAFRNPPDDSLGYTFLVVPTALRALSYGAAWLLSFLPWHTSFAYRGALWDMVIWTVITGIVIRQARRPELPKDLPRRWTHDL